MSEEVKDETKTVVTDEKVSAEETSKEGSPEETNDTKTEKTDDSVDSSKIEDQAAESENRVQAILDKYGYDSYEDLEEDFGGLKELQDLIGKRDAKQLIEDSEYLAKVKEYWQQQEEVKKREEESFDETIARLEKERKELEGKLKDRDKQEAKKKEQQEAKERADSLIKSFNSTVTEEIGKLKDFPKEYKPFLREYLGVDNPANEIDIGLKPEVRSMAKEGIKKFQEFEQLIIKRYLDGKVQTPKMTPDAAQTPVDKEKKPKSLKEARKMLFESFGVGQ